MNIFIVFGSTGEYSDSHEWPVRAFANQEEANQFAVECQKEADAIWNAGDGDEFEKWRAARVFTDNNRQKLDPHLHFDYTGTDYHVSGPIPFGKQG